MSRMTDHSDMTKADQRRKALKVEQRKCFPERQHKDYVERCKYSVREQRKIIQNFCYN